MPKNAKPLPAKVASVAAALVLLLGAPASAHASNHLPGKSGVQLAAQQLKVQPRPGGPAQPKRAVIAPRAGTSATMGCHDHASQTSYEGPCDYYPEYEATGGCESSAEQASVPGNCPNSSEP